jgi:hypothetical protein
MLSLHIIFYLFPTAHNNHVFFEKFRQMISTTSYIHVIVPINFKGLKKQAKQYKNQIKEFFKNLLDTSTVVTLTLQPLAKPKRSKLASTKLDFSTSI